MNKMGEGIISKSSSVGAEESPIEETLAFEELPITNPRENKENLIDDDDPAYWQGALNEYLRARDGLK